MPEQQTCPVIEPSSLLAPLALVVLWNDHDSTMSYVSKTLMKVFRMDVQTAEGVMWTAHTRGCSIAWKDCREHCQHYALVLGQAGLTVSVQEDRAENG